MREDCDAISQARKLAEEVNQLEEKQSGNVKNALENFERQVLASQGVGRSGLEDRRRGSQKTLTALNGELARVLEIIQGSDHGPTTQTIAAVEDLQRSLQEQLSIWNRLKTEELNRVNQQLREAHVPVIALPTPEPVR